MSTPSIDSLPGQLPADPMHWLEAWLNHATENEVQRNPNSMSVATVGENGLPSCRVVLCKHFAADPGFVVFYTNYRSTKGLQLDSHPHIAAVFHWDSLGLQARLEGRVLRSPAAESDAYFSSRDWGSQLGAWGSDQSQPIASRAALVAQVGRRAVKLGVDAALHAGSVARADRPVIERPPHWGGYRIWPEQIELWMEGKDRIHDRARWSRSLTARDDHLFDVSPWVGTRLQP